jgi:hypothetical protein
VNAFGLGKGMKQMAIKIYFPQMIGSDAITYNDGRKRSKEAVTLAAKEHLQRLMKVKPNVVRNDVSFCVYGHESKRLEQLELYGNRIMLRDWINDSLV